MKVKAVGLFSGGLDSALAIKLVQKQGIDVVAFHFSSPFNSNERGDAGELAKKLGVKLVRHEAGDDYLKKIKKPKHGYGKKINPCIDCRIHILKEAKKLAEKIGAKFIFTGEVLGQRPMSQHKGTMMLIEKEAGLSGKLLRPLSAHLLPETEAEKKGWVDREKLMDIEGRRRIEQLKLAKRMGIKGFNYGGSGCRLTDPEYSKRMRDLFESKKNAKWNDVLLLNYGRHFRAGKSKIIVGRNEKENSMLVKLKQKTDYVFEARDFVGPVTLLQGPKAKEAVELAAKLTARYSDSDTDEAVVNCKKGNVNKEISAGKITEEEIKEARV
jgi:tRNA U34 2-thiouridine synthase MnmA/TrmU